MLTSNYVESRVDALKSLSSRQLSATPGATVTLALNDKHPLWASWTAGEAETVNLVGVQYAGQELTLLIANDGTQRVITFGTGFRSSGTVSGTINKVAVIKFISDGTSFFEVSRTLAL